MQEGIDMLIRYLKKHRNNITDIEVEYPIMCENWEADGGRYTIPDKTRKIITIELSHLRTEK